MSRLGAAAIGAALGLLAGLLLTTHRLDERVKAHKARADTAVTRSEVLDLELQVSSAERAQRDAEINRLRLQLAERDTIPLPQPRPRPEPVVTPPDYAAAVAALNSVTAERDSLWEDGQQLRQRIGRDAVKLAAAAQLIGGLDAQVESLTRDLGLVTADRDSLRAVVEATPYAGRCRILGVIPCPTIVGGYGATVADGGIHHGPSVTAGWELKL